MHFQLSRKKKRKRKKVHKITMYANHNICCLLQSFVEQDFSGHLRFYCGWNYPAWHKATAADPAEARPRKLACIFVVFFICFLKCSCLF